MLSLRCFISEDSVGEALDGFCDEERVGVVHFPNLSMVPSSCIER